MIIQWFGYSYFRIDSKNKIIAINPCFKSSTKSRIPRFKSDILLIPNKQEDYDNKNIVMGNPLILEGAGEIETGGVFIEGIAQKSNTIYLIKSENMVICHLGNLEKKSLKEEILEKIANADILLVPISEHGTINYEEAISLINQIEPKIIVPMEYALPGSKIKSDPLDKFIKAISKKPEVLDKLVIRKNNLPTETKLIILNKQ